MALDRYSRYTRLLFSYPADGVLLITMNRPAVGNAMDETMHTELVEVWADVEVDADTRVVVVTGAGERFSMGGEASTIALTERLRRIPVVLREAGALVYNVVNCDKVVITAINGPAAAGGAALALVADISVMADDVWISDSHTRAGLVAGDHPVLVWPAACSLTKAKYYLMTGDKIDGREAERIGLVTFSLPRDQVVDKALEIATRLAAGSQTAIRWTKRSLNRVLLANAPAFEQSVALELLSMFTEDVAEFGVAVSEGRRPIFPSAQPAAEGG